MGGSGEVLSGRVETTNPAKAERECMFTSLFFHVGEKVWDLSGFLKTGKYYSIEVSVSGVE